MASQRKILITSCNSTIGRALTIAFVKNGYHVVGTYRKNDHRLSLLNDLQHKTDRLELKRLDVTVNGDFLNLPKDIDIVVHNTGLSPQEGVSQEDILGCNITGSHNLVEWMQKEGVERIIYLSTISIYSEITDHISDRFVTGDALTTYAATKLLGEKIFSQSLKSGFGMIIRLPAVLDRYATRPWICNLLGKFRRNETITIFNPDTPFNSVTTTYALANFIEVLVDNLEQGVGLCDLAAASPIHVREVADQIKEETHSKSSIEVQSSNRVNRLIDCRPAANLGYLAPEVRHVISWYIDQALTR